jgi:hypothetical protein
VRSRIGAIAFVVLAATLTLFGQDKPKGGRHVILPNPKLVRCASIDCYQLWSGKAPERGDIYPVRVEIALLDKPCPFGLTAIYDKSVAFEDLQAALEAQYGKGTPEHWTNAPLMIWQVNDGDFMIVLDMADEEIAKARRVDVGTKELFFDDARMPTTTCNPK